MGAFLKPFAGAAGALVLVLWLAAGPYLWFYDRNPNAQPLIHWRFLFVHMDWPDNPSAKAALSVASMKQCQTNEADDLRKITAQNASLTALSAAGSRATAEAAGAVQQAQKPLARASEARTTISAPIPAGDDVCAAAKVVDQRLLESIR